MSFFSCVEHFTIECGFMVNLELSLCLLFSYIVGMCGDGANDCGVSVTRIFLMSTKRNTFTFSAYVLLSLEMPTAFLCFGC